LICPKTFDYFLNLSKNQGQEEKETEKMKELRFLDSKRFYSINKKKRKGKNKTSVSTLLKAVVRLTQNLLVMTKHNCLLTYLHSYFC
jgi:hypothetical protein